MGRKVNFILSNLDQQLLLRAIAEEIEIACVIPPEKTAIPHVRHLSECAEWKYGDFTPYLFQPQSITQLQWEYIAGWGGYLPASDEIEVITFRRCTTRENKIVRGRFYYEATTMDAEGRMSEKSSSFIKFAKRVFAITKKFCPLLEEGRYIGPDAEQMRRNGYEFVDAI